MKRGDKVFACECWIAPDGRFFNTYRAQHFEVGLAIVRDEYPDQWDDDRGIFADVRNVLLSHGYIDVCCYGDIFTAEWLGVHREPGVECPTQAQIDVLLEMEQATRAGEYHGDAGDEWATHFTETLDELLHRKPPPAYVPLVIPPDLLPSF